MRLYEQDFDEYTNQTTDQENEKSNNEEAIQQLNKAFDILSVTEQLLLRAPLTGCRRKVFRYVLRAKRLHKDISERQDLQNELPVLARLYVKLIAAIVGEVKQCLQKKQL